MGKRSATKTSTGTAARSKKPKIVDNNFAAVVETKSGDPKQGFPMIVSPTVLPHTLILGCFPSPTSLAHNEYFAFPTNKFWDIAGFALGFDRKQTPYELRVKILTDAGFALWDVHAEAKTEGASDSNLRDTKPNLIRETLQAHPSITRVVMNSKNAGKFFLKYFKPWLSEKPSHFLFANDFAKEVFAKYVCADISLNPLSVYVMHGTSGAHSTVKPAVKYEQWLADCYRSTKKYSGS